MQHFFLAKVYLTIWLPNMMAVESGTGDETLRRSKSVSKKYRLTSSEHHIKLNTPGPSYYKHQADT